MLHETIEQLKQLGLESITHAIDETTRERVELKFDKPTVFADVSELNDDDLLRGLQSGPETMLPEIIFSRVIPEEKKPAAGKRNTDSFLGVIRSPHHLFKKQKIEKTKEETSRPDPSVAPPVTPK